MENFYVYKNLEVILEKLENCNIKSIDIELVISLGKGYYEGEMLYKLLEGVKKQLLNNSDYILNKKAKFKVNTIRFKVADTLNRHNIYYSYLTDYLMKNNLPDETKLDDTVKAKIKSKSYRDATQQGIDWFINNLNAINLLFPKNKKLNKNFSLNDKITTLYEGDKDFPKVEFCRYKYWLEHAKYKTVEKSLKSVCVINESLIQRAFLKAVDYFVERIKKREDLNQFEDFRRKQSYQYLFDETVAFIIKHCQQNNVIEFYYGGRETSSTEVFRGRKAQNDPILKQLMAPGQPLEGADQRKFVSIKLVE
jgi:hypothetical protein